MRLILIDGNSLLNRAYYALPMLNDTAGTNVNAVYGFCNILLKVIADYEPTHLAVAFDERGKTFRHEMYPGYKAQRKGMPDDLAAQMPIIKKVLASMNVKTISQQGVEGDDIIGTLAKRFGLPTYILTGDKDMFQLIDGKINVLLTHKGVSEVEKVDASALKNVYSLTPSQIIDYKALRGDTSDNIPGVRGIGEKTATSLLEEYGTLDGVYIHLGEVKEMMRNRLAIDKDMAYLSRTLATINVNVELDCTLDDLTVNYDYADDLLELLTKLRFNSIIKRLKFADKTALEEIDAKTELINNAEQAKTLVKHLLTQAEVAVFIDTDIHFACDTETEYVVKAGETLFDEFTFAAAVQLFAPVFAGSSQKICFDCKSIRHFLAEFNLQLNNVKYDCDILEYVVNGRSAKNAREHLQRISDEHYACALIASRNKLLQQLKDKKQQQLYYEVELPLSDVLYEMENEGVKVDTDALAQLGSRFSEQIEQLNEQIYALAGERFNIASPKQLAHVLYEKLGLAASKRTKTGFSTDAEVLEELSTEHEIVPLILQVRQYSKLLGTYIEGMKGHIGAHNLIHTKYNQTLTNTGRLSSSEPNLQNIPIRSEEGREIRKMFVSKYGKLVSADYSQIELRLLAAFSQDESMCQAFNEGADIHTKVAANIFKTVPELVNSSMRRSAKTISYGLIYGMSAYRLSRGLGNNNVAKAKGFMDAYFSAYPTIKTYLDKCISDAQDTGYAVTLFGRRRYIPELKSDNRNIREFGKRVAMNMPLQGSAADIMKIAMIRVANRLHADGLKSKLIMQIHDELVIDCYPDEVQAVKKLLQYEMEHAVALAVPLTADAEEGDNLYDAKS